MTTRPGTRLNGLHVVPRILSSRTNIKRKVGAYIDLTSIVSRHTTAVDEAKVQNLGSTSTSGRRRHCSFYYMITLDSLDSVCHIAIVSSSMCCMLLKFRSGVYVRRPTAALISDKFPVTITTRSANPLPRLQTNPYIVRINDEGKQNVH